MGLAAGACAAPAPETEPEPAAPGSPDLDELGDLVERELAGGWGAVVLVARGDRVLLREAHGPADRATGRPMRADDTLRIGSITKSFTAAAILRLVEAGALALDDDVRLHVPEAPTAGRAVTLEQLLTHTSGMPNLIDQDGFEEWAQSPRTTQELVAHTEGLAWISEPGEAFHYSDSGYILLGAVIERATGMAYDEYVVSEIAAPLGMHGTRSAHRPRGGEPVGTSDGAPPPPMHMTIPHASGQLASTVDDLLRWVRAWRDGEVVGPELARRAWTGRTLPDGAESGYGFGWKRDTLADHTVVGHGGWVPGYTAAVVHVPEEDLTAVVLVNDDEGPVAGYVARRCLRLLLTGSPFVQTVEVDASRRASLTGTYRTDRGSLLHVAENADGTALTVQWEGDPIFDLVALSLTTFAVAESDGTWRFSFEPDVLRPTWVRPSLSGEPRPLARRIAP